MIVSFNSNAGIVQDVPSHRLPSGGKDPSPIIWSSGANVRFRDGYAQKSLGHSEPYGTPSIAPYFLLPTHSETVQYWIYAGLTSVYVTQGTSQHDISGATYLANADDSWNGSVFSHTAILNNGIDAPQYWADTSPSTLLADLPNWPASTTCKTIKPFKDFLVAMGIQKPTGSFPHMIKWSHPADPGTVPISWDETDTTKDAGEVVLSQGGGHAVDGGVLGDSFILYHEHSTWEMRHIGGRYIFQFREVFGDSGILSTDCFAEFEGKHCVLTSNDLVVHDTRNYTSIIDRKMRDTLFNDIDETNIRRTYLTANYQKNEIWVCYPESGQSFSTKALVWNYRDNTFGFRSLPGARHIAYGVVDSTLLGTIDSYTDTIDSYTDVFDKRLYDFAKGRMLMADTTNTKLFEIDDTNQFNAVSFTSTLQRTGLSFGDQTSIKSLSHIYPHFEAVSGTAISVRVGYQSAIEGTVTWGTAQTFTVGTDYRLSFSASAKGRLLAVEFETTGDVAWKLHSFDLDVMFHGKQ